MLINTFINGTSDAWIYVVPPFFLILGALCIYLGIQSIRTRGIIIVDNFTLLLPRDKKEIPLAEIDHFAYRSHKNLLTNCGIITIHTKSGECINVGDTVVQPNGVSEELNRRLG